MTGEANPAKAYSAPTAQGRPFTSIMPSTLLEAIQTGVMRTVYRGIRFNKNPFDIALYLQLMSRLRPRTVIEIGTKAGGSALWFADMMSASGIDAARVLSVDINQASEIRDPRIAFLTGDAKRLDRVLDASLLAGCARPWLVVEDSSHFYEDVRAVLEFFHQHLHAGDYIVVEDGVVSQLPGPQYARYEDGPNRAVSDFLAGHADCYAIDAGLCDHYGRNVTYNPNGWLRRTR